MARLRPITKEALTSRFYDIKSRDIIIEEGTQYKVADKMFQEDESILYIYYWSDKADKNNEMYTYPIERWSVKY